MSDRVHSPRRWLIYAKLLPAMGAVRNSKRKDGKNFVSFFSFRCFYVLYLRLYLNNVLNESNVCVTPQEKNRRNGGIITIREWLNWSPNDANNWDPGNMVSTYKGNSSLTLLYFQGFRHFTNA